MEAKQEEAGYFKVFSSYIKQTQLKTETEDGFIWEVWEDGLYQSKKTGKVIEFKREEVK